MLLLIFFMKDFFDKVFTSLGISFQVENLKKFFVAHDSWVLNVKVLKNSYVMFICDLLMWSSIINLDTAS